MSKTYRGYIFSREIDGNIIPQRVQNLVVRTLAQQKGDTLLLSAAEYNLENCYMVLNGILSELTEIDGFIFYSLWMLPPDFNKRQELFDQVLSQQAELHFALEGLSLTRPTDVALIEDILLSKQLSAQSHPSLQRLQQ